MNTPNPLVPQGAIPSRSKSTVRIAFFTIAAIHVVFIGGLLMQGCKKPEDKPVTTTEDPNLAPPPYAPMTQDVAMTDSAYTNQVTSVPEGNAVDQTPYTPPVQTSPEVAVPDPSREYVVAKGDSFWTIAKRNGVSVKGIEQANPGVSSTSLKVGQKLQLPAPSAPSPASTSTEPSNSSSSSNGTITYVVRAGDMLEKIGRRHGTTAKAIMRENNLRTTMIKPGQKLRIPTSAGAAGEPVAGSNYVTPLPSGESNP